MSWYLYALLGTMLQALAAIVRKVMLGDKGRDIYTTSFLFSLAAFLVLGVYALFGNFTMPPIETFWWVFVLNVSLAATGWLTSQKGLKLLPIGENTILLTSRLLVTWIISVLFLGIGLSGSQGLGVGLISLAIFVVFFKKQEFIRSNRAGVTFTLLTALIYGTSIITDQLIYRKSDPASYMLIGFGMNTLILGALKPRVLRSARLLLKPKTGPGFLVCGALISTSLVLIFTGLKLADNASLVTGILQLQTIFTVIFGIILLRERKGAGRILLGALLSAVGAYFLLK